MVVAALAVGAAPAGNAGFERDSVARFEADDVVTDGDDLARALVAEDERFLDDVVADPTVFVVVDVRATDTDFADRDQHLVRCRLRFRTIP